MKAEIRLASGGHFDFSNPPASRFQLSDIAHSLSNLCRFTGHTREFYSVAQHAVMCSHLVHPELALQALHHDDAEAFIGDMAKPLKCLLPDYRAVEVYVEAEVFDRLGLPRKLDPRVKRADRVMQETERLALMAGPFVPDPHLAAEGIHPLPGVLGQLWSPATAAMAFLQRHEELGGIFICNDRAEIEAAFARDGGGMA